MQGDSIVIEDHHKKAAQEISKALLTTIQKATGKYTITVAGESGSGKSEIAQALAEAFSLQQINTVIFQQDDYFVYPPKTNDRTRRADISWVGPQEVHLDLLNDHLDEFIQGQPSVNKPLANYAEDKIFEETMHFDSATIAIAEGTYTTLLESINTRIFIDRNYLDTKKHRERRMRDASELDEFIDSVLEIEHNIISQHKEKADIIINNDYSVSLAK